MTSRPITFATIVYSVALFILFFIPACSLLTCPEEGCAEPVVHYGEGRGPAATAAPSEAPAAPAPAEAPAEAPAPSAPSEGKGHGGKGGHHGKGDHDDGDHDDD